MQIKGKENFSLNCCPFWKIQYCKKIRWINRTIGGTCFSKINLIEEIWNDQILKVIIFNYNQSGKDWFKKLRLSFKLNNFEFFEF